MTSIIKYMHRPILRCLLPLIGLMSISSVQAQQTKESRTETFALLHGPYLQEVTTEAATIVFETSDKAFSWVEVKPHGAADTEARRALNSRDGLFEAYHTFGAVRLSSLKPDSRYDYRIISKQMLDFQPYKVTFGDSIASPWYTFSTLNPKQKEHSIFVTSDIHADAAKLRKLLELAEYKSCTSFFYVGDMMNYIHNPKAPFKAFIDCSVELFASSIPFEVVRGNHETRGNLARNYSGYFPKENGEIYGSYLLGDVMVVMLDGGEDKQESHWVYAGLTDFDAYRSKQAAWLKQLVKSKAYRSAKHHIVMCHFPMVMEDKWEKEGTWHGWADAIQKFLPILNEAKVDLMVSGHTHRYFYHETGVKGNRFPVLEQGFNSATRIDIHNGKIFLKVIDTNGKILQESEL